jgi:type IV pilus assembly protein PilE
LIELLVVVLIIGILSAVALPQYQKTVEKSRASEVYSYVSAWEKAQNVYRLENGTYTDDLENLSITLPELKYFTVNMKEHDTGGVSLWRCPPILPSQ